MTWLSVTKTALYILLLPFTTILSWVLMALAPVLHLGNYMIAGLLLPLKILARFETVYIYLGVAVVIGLLTGSILHFSSSVLVSIFKLTTAPEETGRSAASVRAAREQKKLEEAWQFSSSKGEQGKWKSDAAIEKKYAEWLEKDLGKRRDDYGLLGQTIIEEDDDSEDVF